MKRSPDFQSLQLTEEPPEDDEDDPFTAKLMSFEVKKKSKLIHRMHKWRLNDYSFM